MNGNLARKKELSVTKGVHVDSLLADGAARTGGIQQGDVIVRVDDKPIKSVAELQETIGRHRPGDQVAIVVNRRGKEKTLIIPLKNPAGNTTIERDNRSAVLKSLGVEFSDLTEEDKKKSGVEAGVKIATLYPGVLRSSTDIREGFIITKINRTAVKTTEQMIEVLESQEGGVMIEGVYPGDPTIYYYAFGI